MSRAPVYVLHREHPEPQKLARISEALLGGALMLYPTDTVQALGCIPSCKAALDRLRQIKGDNGRGSVKPVTLLCPTLSEISRLAHVGDGEYKLMKALTPGPFTFILRATREVPKLVLNPRRKTVGLRVPDHQICQALLQRTGNLLLSTSACLPGGEEPDTLEELIEALSPHVDLIVKTDQPFSRQTSTVIDLSRETPEVLREGLGMELLDPYLAKV